MGNTVVDATDGAIVLFCATGTIVRFFRIDITDQLMFCSGCEQHYNSKNARFAR